MNAAVALTGELPQEERQDLAHEEAYQRLVARLSHQSVVKHFDAYADVPWDDPTYAIDPADPRFELPADDPLAQTDWYRRQAPETRARIGLHMIATFARIGIGFESVLKRGILEFAQTLPDGAPEFRYAYHEVIEEAQHSLMFHEFVRRTGLEVRPPWVLGIAERRVIRFGRTFPELFFMLVLSGEDPIDWVQRQDLQSGRRLHPLIERISRIHITEEARHISFARHYLRRAVPQLPAHKMLLLRVRTPLIFKTAAELMMRPSEHVVRTYGIPRDVMRAAYGRHAPHRRRTVQALRKPRELCWEIGVLNDAWSPYWRALGVWAPRGA
jgi:hypothetical protein